MRSILPFLGVPVVLDAARLGVPFTLQMVRHMTSKVYSFPTVSGPGTRVHHVSSHATGFSAGHLVFACHQRAIDGFRMNSTPPSSPHNSGPIRPSRHRAHVHNHSHHAPLYHRSDASSYTGRSAREHATGTQRDKASPMVNEYVLSGVLENQHDRLHLPGDGTHPALDVMWKMW